MCINIQCNLKSQTFLDGIKLVSFDLGQSLSFLMLKKVGRCRINFLLK